MAKTIKIWCIECNKVTPFSIAPNEEDHNRCTACLSHADRCRGCLLRERKQNG